MVAKPQKTKNSYMTLSFTETAVQQRDSAQCELTAN
jgi:hypothetical protein